MLQLERSARCRRHVHRCQYVHEEECGDCSIQVRIWIHPVRYALLGANIRDVHFASASSIPFVGFVVRFCVCLAHQFPGLQCQFFDSNLQVGTVRHIGGRSLCMIADVI